MIHALLNDGSVLKIEAMRIKSNNSEGFVKWHS